MNIYSAKFMNEASASLADKVFRKNTNETYLFSTIAALREMNNIINENTKQMYIQISEAESKEDENKIFANYFYQFKQIFQDFANKIEEMKSRMIISVENKVETWEDLISDDGYISSFDEEFEYNGYEFSHINDANYPRFDLNKIYQKEFDYIAQIMQDSNTTSGLSYTSKLKIIASVSNNFVKTAGDKHWIKSIIKDMVDECDDDCGSYSECIYNSLREKKNITVNKGVLYNCKENLIDYEDVIDSASKLCNDLLYDLNKVAENISSYVFRNEDKKLKIKTDTDGIIDRDYRLDTYSMNQLDLFLKNKVNQIKKVLNVYTIAIGIKFDTVVDYIDQSIDILNIAKSYHYNNISDEDMDNEDDLDDNDVSTDTDDTTGDLDDTSDLGDDETIDDSEGDDLSTDDTSNDLNNDDEIPDISDDTEKEPINEEEPEDNTDDEVNKLDIDAGSDNFDEAYLFEAELFEIESVQETAYMHKMICEALLLEADPQENTNNNSTQDNAADNKQPDSGLKNVQKLADQSSAWSKIIQKLVDLWRKFKDAVLQRVNSKVKYLNDNKKYIAVKLDDSVLPSDGIGFKYTPDLGKLNTISIPDLNYESMKQYLTSDENFIKQYFRDFNIEGKSVSEAIKTTVLGEPQNEIKSFASIKGITIQSAYDFCVNYQKNTDRIRVQTDAIQKAEKVAKDVSKVTESSMNTADQYFNEFEAKDDGVDKSKAVSTYFKICSQVLAAEMTVYQKLFDELYEFCRWYIKAAGGNDNQNDQQQNNNNNA